MTSLFDELDEANPTLAGVDFNWWRAHREARRSVLVLGVLSTVAWFFYGFDSGLGPYGVSLHYSTVSTYCLLYYMLSRRLEEEGIAKTRNVSASIALSLGCVGLFECMWMLSYAAIRNQWWILGSLNRGNVIVHSTLMLLTPATMLAGKLSGYDVKTQKGSLFAYTTMLGLWAVWWSIGFTQTSYPQPGAAPLYTEDNLIHFLNVAVKAASAYAASTGPLISVKKNSGSDSGQHS